MPLPWVPQKNPHPQAASAFRKSYGAFETLCDLVQQQRLLLELSHRAVHAALSADMEEIQKAIDAAGNGDEDDGDGDEEENEDSEVSRLVVAVSAHVVAALCQSARTSVCT